MRAKYLILSAVLGVGAAISPLCAQQSATEEHRTAPAPRSGQIPLVSVGNKWNVVHKTGAAGMPDIMHEKRTYEYKAVETVVIDDKAYVRIDVLPTNAEDPVLPSISMREEPETGKVFRVFGSSGEYEVFDYNRPVGQVFKDYTFQLIPEVSFIIAKIEQQEFAGKQRRFYYINGFYDGEDPYASNIHYVWIEGIGDTQGFDPYPLGMDGGIPNELICFEDSEGNSYVKYPDLGCVIHQVPAAMQEALQQDSPYQITCEGDVVRILCPSGSQSNTIRIHSLSGALLREVVSTEREVTIRLPRTQLAGEAVMVSVNDRFARKVRPQ
ncbi:hypothetical protein HR13_04355 [Porphyromonas gulae]|uniref:hypothetical protein n=1 Tax=Porphyromonas gulae TaxID=111105 RepID=UPI0003A24ED4|nr:hypothetical protein [Porphyromonas gulae]KGN68023.1 hypothetical protein HR09_09505 [Porphyromonas gulae]KGN80372.1 hypothetical protein HR13_04355 [Porphyromonas gulae]